MSYGDTYQKEPTKEEISQKNSLIAILCSKSGYNREDLENTELESKIDILSKKGLFGTIKITLGEELSFPVPYSKDKILEASKSIHKCYAFIGDELTLAFTQVDKNNQTKIKVKDYPEYIENNGITLIKRVEKHENLSELEITKYISDKAISSNLPLEYIGSFSKESKEAFVFNPTSGRIFVVSTNICEINSNSNKLHQLEIEYYGQINGFSTSKKVYEDMAYLVGGILENLSKRYVCKNSTLTKFEWLVKNAKR